MRIAITGATGLVGSHLTAELLGRGYDDIVLVVRDAGKIHKLERVLEKMNVADKYASLHFKTSQLNNPVSLKKCFRGVDVVFHCAASVAIGGTDHDIVKRNVEITQHIVDACLDARVSKLVHVSSVAVLASSGAEQPTDESILRPTFKDANDYAASKILSEYEIMRANYLGLETIVVCPATILGLTGDNSGSGAIVPVLSKGIPFYTSGMTGYVYICDVARAMALLFEEPSAYGQRFLLCGANITYRDFIGLVNKTIGKKAPEVYLSKCLAVAASYGDKILSFFTRKPHRLTREMVNILYDRHSYNGDKVCAYIDFSYTPFEKVVENIINEYRSIDS